MMQKYENAFNDDARMWFNEVVCWKLVECLGSSTE